MTNEQLIQHAVASGASVGKCGDAAMSLDQMRMFAEKIRNQTLEDAAKVIETFYSGKHAVAESRSYFMAKAIRDMKEE